MSECGFVYGSKRWNSQFSVDSQVRTQLTKQPPRSSFKGISLSEHGSEGFRVRLKRLSEYGSVAYLAERPTRERQAEQHSDTVLTVVLEIPHEAGVGDQYDWT